MKHVIAIVGIFFVAAGFAAPVFATGSIEVQDQSIATASVPIDGTASTLGSVGIIRLEIWEPDSSTAPSVDIDSVSVDLTGTIDPSDVSDIRVIFETQGDFDGDTILDNDGVLGSGQGEQELVTGDFTGGSPVTLTFPAPENIIMKSEVANGNAAYLYIVFDIEQDATLVSDRTVGANVRVSGVGARGGFFEEAFDRPSDTTYYSSSVVHVDRYNNLSVDGYFSGTPDRRIDSGSSEVVFRSQFAVPDASLEASAFVTVDRIRLKQIGTAQDSDFATSNAVVVVLDADNDGIADGGEPTIGSASVSGGYADVTLDSPTAIGSTGLQFLFKAAMSPTAVINRTIGFQIEDPSVDIDFSDGIDDTAAGYLSTQYPQTGVITGSTATPASPDTFVISEFVAPEVSATSPSNGATLVPRDANASATFNEDMAGVDGSEISLVEDPSGSASPVAGTGSYDAPSRTITFNPDVLLAYGTVYEATVSGTVEDVAGNTLDGGDYTFTFTVDSNQFRVSLPTTPASSEVGVPRNESITVTFSDDLAQNEAALEGLFDLIEDPDGAATSTLGSFTKEDATTISFDPTDLLAYGETYEVVLDGTIEDTVGSLLSEWSGATGPGGSYTFRFTTNGTQFRVLSTTPADEATAVSRFAGVQIVFNEDVDESTLVLDSGDDPDPANWSVVVRGNNGAGPVEAGTLDYVAGTNTLSFSRESGTWNYLERYEVTVDGDIANTIGSLISESDGAPSGDYVFQFTIEPPTPPEVLSTTPAAGDTDVDIDAIIVVLFSEAMTESDLLEPGNVVLSGPDDEVAATLEYNELTFFLTVAPDSELPFGGEVTLTIDAAVEDRENSTLGESYGGDDFVLRFNTENEWPEFSEPIVTNNRILPGSTEPVRIFVVPPTPDREDDEVTVQVYSSSGRRIDTLTEPGTTFADLGTQRPIEWAGRNGRGQDLAPGLYFVQVSSGDYRHVLRVLIVR